MRKDQLFQSVKTRLILMLAIWFGAAIVHEAHSQELENSMLWKIEGDSIETSYLFGTFHLLPQADFELKDKVKSAFDGSQQIVMELDMDSPTMQSELMKNAFMEKGQTLDMFFTQEEYSALDAYLIETANISLKTVNRFKPFFVSAMVIPSLIEGSPASYEMSFVQRAMSTSKKIYGLETPKEQMSSFDNIAYDKQAKELLKITTEKKEMVSLFKTMIKNYKKENVTKMYELVVENMADEEQVMSLLTKRNENWIPKIGEFAEGNSTFFAVGAGHLGGESGLIQLLRDAGYTLTPVQE